MKPLQFHPQTEVELSESVSFYNSRVPGLGYEFLSAVKAACETIQKDPIRRPSRPDNTRKFRVRRFPYNVIYRDEPERILIVAVAHGARLPGYWQQRL